MTILIMSCEDGYLIKTDGKKVLSETQIDKIIYDSSITDCNDAFEMGKIRTYWVNQNVGNIPTNNNGWYIIALTNSSSISTNGYVTQIATPADNQNKNQMFIRHKYVKTYSPFTMDWTIWKEL